VLRLDLGDRRRVALASAITVIALPSLWLMSRNEESGAPNVATAGVVVAPADDSPDESVAAVTTTAPVPDAQRGHAMGDPGAAFLDGPPADPSDGVVAIAVPQDAAGRYMSGTATYRSSVPGTGTCLIGTTAPAKEVTVTNLDNGRSITCRTSVAALNSPDDVVLHTDAFRLIADLTDAPVPVELSW
jgi:hypothetical protein